MKSNEREIAVPIFLYTTIRTMFVSDYFFPSYYIFCLIQHPPLNCCRTPGGDRIVERRVEVFVDRIVERVVHVPVGRGAVGSNTLATYGTLMQGEHSPLPRDVGSAGEVGPHHLFTAQSCLLGPPEVDHQPKPANSPPISFHARHRRKWPLPSFRDPNMLFWPLEVFPLAQTSHLDRGQRFFLGRGYWVGKKCTENLVPRIFRSPFLRLFSGLPR